jgi:hypothetical protein
MGDSLYNFDDLSYTGLTDTAAGFTGSSTVQDVQLGSPLVLDTQYLDGPLGPVSNVSTPDFLSSDLSTSDFFVPAAQTLTGASDTPPSSASIAASTPTPVATPGSNLGTSALTGLSKFGSALAGLLGGQPKTVSATATPLITASGAQLPSAYTTSGSLVLVAVIVVGALILLLARGD